MSNVIIRSKVKGHISYDVYPGKEAVTVKIEPGLNQIDEKLYDLLVKDPGFVKQIERDRYEELSNKEVKAEKTVADANAEHEAEIKQLKEANEAALKKAQEETDELLKQAEKDCDEKIQNLKGDKKALEDQVTVLEAKIKKLEKENKDLQADLKKAKS